MAGGDVVDESQLKGISKYFNSTTMMGRANVSRSLNVQGDSKELVVQYF